MAKLCIKNTAFKSGLISSVKQIASEFNPSLAQSQDLKITTALKEDKRVSMIFYWDFVNMVCCVNGHPPWEKLVIERPITDMDLIQLKVWLQLEHGIMDISLRNLRQLIPKLCRDVAFEKYFGKPTDA